jgi:hypothetical protein
MSKVTSNLNRKISTPVFKKKTGVIQSIILRYLRIKVWRICGYDTFAGEWYPLDGIFLSEGAAMRAARQHLNQLEKMQPTPFSGGQDGIQDQVYIIRPDGTIFRYSPLKE